MVNIPAKAGIPFNFIVFIPSFDSAQDSRKFIKNSLNCKYTDFVSVIEGKIKRVKIALYPQTFVHKLIAIDFSALKKSLIPSRLTIERPKGNHEECVFFTDGESLLDVPGIKTLAERIKEKGT